MDNDLLLLIIFGSATVIFSLYILYYGFVTVPRRKREIFSNLEAQGFQATEPDDPGLFKAVTECAPLCYNENPYDRSIWEKYNLSKWKIKHAVIKNSGNEKQYLIAASRGLVYENKNNTSMRESVRETPLIFCHKVKLSFNEEIYIRANPKPNDVVIDPKLGLKRVKEYFDPDFLENFVVLTASGHVTQFPEGLQSVLSKWLPEDPPLEMPTRDGLYPLNLKFSRTGMGISANIRHFDQVTINSFLHRIESITKYLNNFE